MSNPRRKRFPMFGIALGTISLLAFLLRAWGIDFGLPYEYHVDEVQYVRQAASMGERGLEPVMWGNPPLFKYILLLEYGSVYIAGRITGLYSSPSAFGAAHSLDPTLLYLLGRGTNAIFGALTVLLLGLAGKSVFNRRVGLLSAWFLAVCFIHVRDSHFAVNDILLTLFASITFFASLKILSESSNKSYIGAGIGLGLGFATKYTAVLSAVAIILAHVLSRRFQPRNFEGLRLPQLALCGIVAVFSSILASPYFVLTPGRVVSDIYNLIYLPGRSGFDGWQIHPSGGYIYYIDSMLWGLGLPLAALVVFGAIMGIVHPSKEAAVTLSFPAVLYVVMGHEQMYFARFVIPAIPPLLLWSSNVLDNILERWRPGNRQYHILALLALIIAAKPLIDTARLDWLFEEDDTRTLAKRWIEDNLPDGSKIALEWPFYGPPLSTDGKIAPHSKHRYEVEVVGGTGLDEHSVAWYKANGFDYLVASSFIYDIELASSEKQNFRNKFYPSLNTELNLIQEIRPGQESEALPFIFDEIYGPAITLWQRDRPGPTLKIYELSE